MRFNASFSVLALLIISLGFGCGAQTVTDVMADADKAYRADKDYTKAQTLYRSVLDWKGEGEPTKAQRFEASFNTIRCQVKQKNFDDAVKSLEEMQKIYADSMDYKDLCTIIKDLHQEKGIEQAINVLVLASEVYPDKKDKFEEMAKLLEKSNLSDEQMEKLKKLGYL